MIGISVTNLKGEISFSMSSVKDMSSLALIKVEARKSFALLNTKDFTEKTPEEFLKRLEEFQVDADEGGFTLTYNFQLFVFRYNKKIDDFPDMEREMNGIFFIEFIIRKRLRNPLWFLVPKKCASLTYLPFFMRRLPDGNLHFNFHNHSMEEDLREKFLENPSMEL